VRAVSPSPAGAASLKITAAQMNGMDRAAFVQTFGGVFENSPWVAEQAWVARPFADVAALHAEMCDAVRKASRARQLELLRAHPDLAGRAARAGSMSASSITEQASAGLDRLTDDEYERFARLNAAYVATFGFPFIIAVRRHDKTAILAAFERRLLHTKDVEIATALDQVFEITRLRIDALVVS
jgi:2-oxo-4-hydroxy-4-carboxy-5-ureidoimidazoline decarboxylase